MLRLLAIHEGVPGHYLQLSWANRTQNLARGVFQSGLFAEGWAVYVTQVMMDLGYGDFDPALLISHWKFYLRAITNALMDIAIHTGGMTEQAAMDMMVRGGFQEEDEARRKWLRARLTSTQLCTYYVGSLEMWDMEVEARHRAAVAAGRSADSVPPQRIAGGFGRTADFDYRAHLESVISHGAPPIKWVQADPVRVKFGLILPSYREGASTESIDASSETAARLGWDSVFTTDHVLVEPSDALQGLLQHL